MPAYRWNAEDYARNSAAQSDWARELLAKLNLQGHEQVLDLGCGDGKITAEIAALVPTGTVLGIDSSTEMVRLARNQFPPNTIANLQFRQIDARQLSFKARFNVIFSNAALHWVRDHQPILAGISRSLRPGGRILLQMGGTGNAAPILAVLKELIAADPWRKYFDGFVFPYGFHAPRPYRRWLTRSGLDPLRVELIHKKMIHKGAEGLAGWIRTTWLPYTQRIPAQQQTLFIDDLVSRYLCQYPPDGDGNTWVPMVRLEVEARRPQARG